MAGGGHVWQGEVCMVGDVHGREVCMAGGMHGRGYAGGGACMAGGVHGEGHYEIRSVSERAVRILLECILVFSFDFV